MKPLIMAVLAALPAAASPGAPTAATPSPGQLQAVAHARSFTGTVLSCRTLGFGGSGGDLWVEIAAPSGAKATFFITADTLVRRPDGRYERFDPSRLRPSQLYGRVVEIRYAAIAGKSGAVGGVENGRYGVLALRTVAAGR